MPSYWNGKESKIHHKYAELPDEAKYKKKKKKITIKKSNHKHQYKHCLYKTPGFTVINGKRNTWTWGGTYCTICGRVGDVSIGASKIINDSLPIFELDDLFAKYIPTFSGE